MRASIGSLGCGILFLIAGLFFIAASWVVYSRDTRTEDQGERETGRITGKESLIAADGDSDFYVEYSFELSDGTQLTSRRAVPKGIWDDLSIGDSVEVRYDPAQPERNFPEGGGNTSAGVATFVSFIGVAISLLGTVVIIGALSKSNATPDDTPLNSSP